MGKPEEIVVVGGGGHAKVVISILRKLGCFYIRGYTDSRDNGTLLDTPYLGPDSELIQMLSQSPGLKCVLGVGQIGLGTGRRELHRKLHELGLAFPAIVSSAAVFNEEAHIGDCSVVMDGAVINPGVTVGEGSIINTNSTVEHDVSLGKWVHIACGATLSGGVRVGDLSMIGAGATVIEGRSVAPGTIVGAGATVVHDLLEPGVYVGTPARRIK